MYTKNIYKIFEQSQNKLDSQKPISTTSINDAV